MPAATCDDTQPWVFTINGECDVFFDWTWDGTSTPPNCAGTVQAVRWANHSQTKTYYAHIQGAMANRINLCKIISPGESGSRGRVAIALLGLRTIDDLRGDFLLDQNPPVAGERVIQ